MEEDRNLVFYLYSLKYKQMNGQSYLTRQWHCPSKGAKMFNPLLFIACVYCPWFAHEVRFIWQKVWVLECSKLGIKKNSFRNMRFALNLCRTCRPTSFYVRWFSLTSFDVCWRPLMFIDVHFVCWRSLTFVDIRWRLLTSIDIRWSWRLLISFGVRWPMLMFVMFVDYHWRMLMFVDKIECSLISVGVRWRLLMFGDVRWCLLTFVDVYWCSMTFDDVCWCPLMFDDV